MVDQVRRDVLALDRLMVDLRVARRLPFSLACRYRALPVAEDNGRVTVAMADPGDGEARRAVLAALDSPAYLVRSDPLIIESLLAEIWPCEVGSSLHIVVYEPAGPASTELEGYARQIAGLLKASVCHPESSDDEPLCCDLAIVPASAADWPAAAACRAAIIVGRPRWPLAQILFVLNGSKLDEAAPGWAVRLARLSGAAMTLLAVVCPHEQPGAEDRLDAWLNGDMAAGRQVRRITDLLASSGIEGRLRLRQGPLDREVEREAASGQYDLLVISGGLPSAEVSAGLSGRRATWLHRAGCPVLVTTV